MGGGMGGGMSDGGGAVEAYDMQTNGADPYWKTEGEEKWEGGRPEFVDPAARVNSDGRQDLFSKPPGGEDTGTMVAGPGEGEGEGGMPATPYQDRWAAFLFIAHLAVIFWMAFDRGLPLLEKDVDVRDNANQVGREGGREGVEVASTVYLVFLSFQPHTHMSTHSLTLLAFSPRYTHATGRSGRRAELFLSRARERGNRLHLSCSRPVLSLLEIRLEKRAKRDPWHPCWVYSGAGGHGCPCHGGRANMVICHGVGVCIDVSVLLPGSPKQDSIRFDQSSGCYTSDRQYLRACISFFFDYFRADLLAIRLDSSDDGRVAPPKWL